MDSSSKSSESDNMTLKEKIEKFIYPIPPIKQNTNEKFTARIPLVSNLLDVTTKDNIHIIVSIINIELLNKDKNNNDKNELP